MCPQGSAQELAVNPGLYNAGYALGNVLGFVFVISLAVAIPACLWAWWNHRR